MADRPIDLAPIEQVPGTLQADLDRPAAEVCDRLVEQRSRVDPLDLIFRGDIAQDSLDQLRLAPGERR